MDYQKPIVRQLTYFWETYSYKAYGDLEVKK